MAEPTKAEQMQALINDLRQVLKVAAGGVDHRVQAILGRMEEVLKPPRQS